MPFIYPTAFKLREIASVIEPTLTMDDPVFDIMPIEEDDSHFLIWEQKDNYRGLQNIRGLNGAPVRVNRVDTNRYFAEPGVYGEFETMDEREITTRRAEGSLNQNIDLRKPVMEMQNQLLHREIMRIKSIIWNLLVYGEFSVATETGKILYTGKYTTRSFTAGTPWSTSATATPFANFRALREYELGYGTSFGTDATAFMNSKTFSNMVATTDVRSALVSGGNTPIGQAQANLLLAAAGAPKAVEYNGGYPDDNGVFQKFIPDNTVIVVGKRSGGQRLGAYRKTRNAQNNNAAPGSYSMIKDTLEDKNPPRTLEVHRGHNGGPIIEYPGSIIVMAV